MIRDRRIDPSFGKRIRSAIVLFVVAMLGVGGSVAWSLATSTGRDSGDAQSLSVCCSILFVLAAALYAIVTYARLMHFYRCPRCGTRAPRVRDTVTDSRV